MKKLNEKELNKINGGLVSLFGYSNSFFVRLDSIKENKTKKDHLYKWINNLKLWK